MVLYEEEMGKSIFDYIHLSSKEFQETTENVNEI